MALYEVTIRFATTGATLTREPQRAPSPFVLCARILETLPAEWSIVGCIELDAHHKGPQLALYGQSTLAL